MRFLKDNIYRNKLSGEDGNRKSFGNHWYLEYIII
jgi:hypothetical protein